MRKNREFDDILNECLERLLVKGESLKECLASYPEQADELKPLLQMALSAKKALAIEPRPEFRARARYQFVTALGEAAPRSGRRFFAWRLRWTTVVTTALILLLAGGGVVVAASNSMPDSPLYQVKLAVEQVQLRLTPSDLSRTKLHARLADKRVTEIIYAAQKGDARLVELVTQRLDNHLVMIASLAVAQRGESSMLDVALPLPPAMEADVKSDEGFALQNGDMGELVTLLENYAATHQAKLTAVLATAPETVKPALLEAISVSVAGYEKALNAVSE